MFTRSFGATDPSLAIPDCSFRDLLETYLGFPRGALAKTLPGPWGKNSTLAERSQRGHGIQHRQAPGSGRQVGRRHVLPAGEREQPLEAGGAERGVPLVELPGDGLLVQG